MRPKKWLGQNFLIDQELSDRLVYSLGDLSGRTILEIGPGRGMLSRSIIAVGRPQKLIFVEKDQDLLKYLRENFVEAELICGDALTFDEEAMYEKCGKITIIANLPYNIATLLLYKWLSRIHLFDGIHVMVQKEVAERLMAAQHSSDYGWLSIVTQLYCDVNEVAVVCPSSFYPQPKVDSCFVSLMPLPQPRFEVPFDCLASLCKRLFQHKRKMLRSAPADIKMALQKAGINLELRPQNLSIEELCRSASLL